MVAVSVASEDIPKMREEIGVQFALYVDPTLQVIGDWGVRDPDSEIAVPATFIVDVDGKVRYAHVGTHKKDRPVMEDVLTALRYLAD